MKKLCLPLILLLGCSPVFADTSESNGPALPVNQNVIQTLPGQDLISTILLPNLPEPTRFDTSLLATQNGSLQLKGSLNGNLFLVKQDFANAKNAPLDVDIATQKIPETTVGWLVSTKADKTETILNMGWRFGGDQRLLFSAAEMRGMVSVDPDGKSNPSLNQYSGGLNYRYFLGRNWLNGLELSGYASGSQSQSIQTGSAEDTPQHIAGTNLIGMQLGLESTPLPDAKLKIGIGSERLSYDALSGVEPIQNLNTSIKWSQVVMPTVRYNATLQSKGAERNLSTGLDFNLRNGQQLGVKVAHTQWSDGQLSDNAIQLSYTMQFGKKFTPFQPKDIKAPWNPSLVPEVLQRPSYLPNTVLSKPVSSIN